MGLSILALSHFDNVHLSCRMLDSIKWFQELKTLRLKVELKLVKRPLTNVMFVLRRSISHHQISLWRRKDVERAIQSFHETEKSVWVSDVFDDIRRYSKITNSKSFTFRKADVFLARIKPDLKFNHFPFIEIKTI